MSKNKSYEKFNKLPVKRQCEIVQDLMERNFSNDHDGITYRLRASNKFYPVTKEIEEQIKTNLRSIK